MVDLTFKLKTLDDFFDTITLSDSERMEVVKENAAHFIDDAFQKAEFEIMLQSYGKEFAPDNYIQKLYDVINNENIILEGLQSDLYKLQCVQMPTYYYEHFLNEEKSELEESQFALWAATEIGLHIYLSKSILSYAYKIQDRLQHLTGGEANRWSFLNIYLKSDKQSDKAEILYNKLVLKKQIDANYPFDDFKKFFSRHSDITKADKPKVKIKWKGKVIDLAVLIIFLSDNRPEWLVVENVFGVKSTSLKSSLSNLKKRRGFNKKYHEIATEYEDVK